MEKSQDEPTTLHEGSTFEFSLTNIKLGAGHGKGKKPLLVQKGIQAKVLKETGKKGILSKNSRTFG